MNCNCEFCIKCDCEHKADEHIAGNGKCFICNCEQFHNIIDDAWKELSMTEKIKVGFRDFADNFFSQRES